MSSFGPRVCLASIHYIDGNDRSDSSESTTQPNPADLKAVCVTNATKTTDKITRDCGDDTQAAMKYFSDTCSSAGYKVGMCHCCLHSTVRSRFCALLLTQPLQTFPLLRAMALSPLTALPPLARAPPASLLLLQLALLPLALLTLPAPALVPALQALLAPPRPPSKVLRHPTGLAPLLLSRLPCLLEWLLFCKVVQPSPAVLRFRTVGPIYREYLIVLSSMRHLSGHILHLF